MVLFAYVDETGLNPTAKAVTVAGLVAPLAQWSGITSQWKGRMDLTGISTFHAQPCRGAHKAFKTMSESSRDALYADLAEIVEAFQPQPVAGSVSKTASATVRKDEKFSVRYPSEYSFCFDLCLTAINSIAEERREEVIVIYAVNEQYLTRARLVAEAYEVSQRYLRWIVSCVPNVPERVVPLQVADMLAYEVYHHHQNAKNRPQSDLLARLRYAFLGYEYDEQRLQRLIDGGPTGFVA